MNLDIELDPLNYGFSPCFSIVFNCHFHDNPFLTKEFSD